MAIPIVVLKARPTDYNVLIDLGTSVKTGLTSNAHFPSPPITLTTYQSYIDAVVAAKGVWGPPSNRGSHADLLDLRTKSITLWQGTKSMADYVQSCAQIIAGSDYELMAAIIATSGLQIKAAANPHGVLQAVQNFRHVVSPELNANQVFLKWSKPINSGSEGPPCYKLFRGIMPPVFSTSAVYATTTKTFFIDSNNTGGNQQWSYWCCAVGPDGDGAISEVVVINVPSI